MLEETEFTEIADALRYYARAKNEQKRIRNELVKMAVNYCGIDQSEAVKLDIVTFLDGYLVGNGIIQNWRIE